MSGFAHSGLEACASGIEATLADLRRRDAVAKIWAKDAALWKSEPAHQKIIQNSLGWLTVMDTVRAHKSFLAKFAIEIGQAGFTHVVLLGMGGSSLCPDVLRLTFGSAAGSPALAVLDTTDPSSVRALEQSVDLSHALFVVASKSGTTPEIAAFSHYFFAKVAALKGERAGEQFIAITDPGTASERTGKEKGFRHVFLNPADIGGRYSALSFFGMVPAVLIGLDVLRLLDRADRMAAACKAGAAPENPGLWLGAVLGALAKAGRDKVTFLCSPEIASFGYWVEQLVAESMGKDGTGILPVEGEAPGDPSVYGNDRVFVRLRLSGSTDTGLDATVKRLTGAGHPVLTIELADRYDLGAEFFRWEFATAIAGAVLGINPFDEPNVAESKRNTEEALDEHRRRHALPTRRVLAVAGPLAVVGDRLAAGVSAYSSGPGSDRTVAGELRRHLDRIPPTGYTALQAYIASTPERDDALADIRALMRDRTGRPATAGYGPRFLHSTGQLHKGGTPSGWFLQLVAGHPQDLDIHGAGYTFGTLIEAQAEGDLASLEAHGLPVMRVHLSDDPDAGLAALRVALQAALDLASVGGSLDGAG